LVNAKIEQNPCRLIEEFIPVHKDDVATLAGIKLLYEEGARASGYLASGKSGIGDQATPYDWLPGRK
jgi:hypothetical protein